MIGVQLTGQWQKAGNILGKLDSRFEAAAMKAVLKEAHFIRMKVILNIADGGATAGKPFAPLSPLTLVIRRFRGFGGGKPLIVTGALRGSAVVMKLGGGAVAVGMKRASAGGVNLALLHEEGSDTTRKMTAKQRRFLAAAFRSAGLRFGDGGGGGGMLRIRIPARPYFGPVVEKFAKGEDVRARFWKNVSADLNGDLGR